MVCFGNFRIRFLLDARYLGRAQVFVLHRERLRVGEYGAHIRGHVRAGRRRVRSVGRGGRRGRGIGGRRIR